MKSNFPITKSFEFIQKEKVQNALIKGASKGVLLLLNILVRFMSHGDGTKDKTLLRMF